MTLILKYKDYCIGSATTLTEPQIKHLISCFKAAEKPAEGILSGRIATKTTRLNGVGRVMIKPYFRGGLIRHINKRTYLKIGKSRSRAEFEMLEHVRRIGIKAPEPVAYVLQGSLLYRAWLITKRINSAITLSELGFTDPAAARRVLPEVAEQVRILSSHGIHHVDLHPGNVLVDTKGHAYLIDFDRAKSGVHNLEKLQKRHVKRWKRAADKYGMPGFVRNALEA
ncbi:MAG: phosphotransferase [Desulfobacteraceae bacterium]|nr:phosphotransferase [Desulfobacteraceae bacterium]